MTETIKKLQLSYKTPETPQSFFVSIEGIEGSGKSTQIKALTSWFEQQGYRVLALREPGGTTFGEKLREAILSSSVPLHPLAECHLFLASRAQLLQEKILPFLKTPKSVVIMDRYIDSTLAYQGQARKLGLETILKLHQFAPLNLLPHRTYLLDIGLETSLERQHKRGNHKDYFESQQSDFYLDLIQGYRQAAALFPERILTIDAATDTSSVTKTITTDLASFLSCH